METMSFFLYIFPPPIVSYSLYSAQWINAINPSFCPSVRKLDEETFWSLIIDKGYT